METVKINRRTPVYGFDDLDYEYVIEKDGELVIKLNDKTCYFIEEGDYIYFNRSIMCVNNGNTTFTDFSVVKYEDSNHIIHATLPGVVRINLTGQFFNLKYNENNSYYIISCKTRHYLFGQDLDAASDQEVYFKDINGNLLATYNGIYPLNKYRVDMGIPSNNSSLTSEFVKSDCIGDIEKDDTCGKGYDYVETRHYNFFPDSESTNDFILTDFNEIECKEAAYIEFKYNPFYYYTVEKGPKGEPIELDSHGNPIKHIHFYGDKWFDSFHNTTTVKYVDDGVNINKFYIDRSYYSVSLGLSYDANESNLGVEDYFSDTFAKKIEESLIPEFIDMERVKYSPYEKENNDSYIPITSITIYNHFRERVYVDPDNNTNTLATSGNLYYDGWYIDTDNNYDVYWNGFTGGSISAFTNSSCRTISDLIGFLNFTDNDIFYRKSKVSKSFFRFSFYNSNDPIEQKLLYYSTVFLDSTALFCKFLKQRAFMEDNLDGDEVIINEVAEGNDNVKVVFCENNDVGCRLDTTLTITNEYDKERCSEGFNIYLFSDDVPDGNTEKTIYMKVEFNHAGNGKTFPMIIMPNEPLTVENFIENLFIPIKIKKYNEKYIYTIDGAEYDGSGDLKLCLFEPKLELEG